EPFDSSDPGKGYALKIVLLDFPDDFFLRSDFQHAVTIAGSDQRVAVGQSDSAENGVAERFRAVAAFASFAKERHFVFPDDLACGIILPDKAIAFLSDQVIAAGE